METKNGVTIKKYNDGFMEMWGTSSSSTSGYGTVTFPLAFKDTSYHMYTTPIYYNSSYIVFLCSVSKSTNTNAYVYTRQFNGNNLAGVSFEWYASGFWK